jgi:histidine ammonia-lyase
MWRLLAVEALALAQAADLRQRPGVMGARYQALHDGIRSISPYLVEDRPLYEDIAAVALWLQSPQAQAALLPARPKNPIIIALGGEA